MRYFDLIGQSLILLAFSAGMFGTGQNDQDTLMLVFFAQMVLGPWQMLSSLISLLAEAPFHKLKLIHFLTSLVYLLVLALFATQARGGGLALTFFAIAPAWTLAIFYYYITCRWAFMRQRKSGKFLPNVFF